MKRTKKIGGMRLTVWSSGPERKPIEDMCMPDSYAAMGIFGLTAGVVVMIITFATGAPFWMAMVGFASFAGGVLLLLAWKNRVIRMLPGDRFEYVTAFGRKQVYYFSDISELRMGFLCWNLMLGDRTIQIDSDAVVSEKLRSCLEARKRELCGDGSEQKPRN